MERHCFVCCEEGGWRVCLCRTVIHDGCFRNLVTKVEAHKNGCPVCKREYDTERGCAGGWHIVHCVFMGSLLLFVLLTLAMDVLYLGEQMSLYTLFLFAFLLHWTTTTMVRLFHTLVVLKVKDARHQWKDEEEADEESR